MNMDTKITASKPLKIDTTFNTRDLGGYKTKDEKTTKTHAFLRSDLPAQITEYSRKVLLDYGVRCVVDLRSMAEVNSMPSALKSVSEIDYYSLPMLDQTTSQGFNGKMPDNMGTVYIDLLNNSQIDFGKMFHIFAQHKEHTWGDAEKYLLDAAISKEDIRTVKSMLVD